MKEKFLTRGNISLFIIALAATVIAGFVCNLCGADRITSICTAPMVGILAMLGIGAACEAASLRLTDGPEPGILGVIFGTLACLALF